MGFAHMTFIIFMLISLNILMVDARGQNKLYFMEYSGNSRQNKVGGVSGEDKSEDMGASVLEKFRVLLGLKSLRKTKPTTGALECCGLPSPSPSSSPSPTTIEIEAPAPAPVRPIHVHFHHQSPHLSRTLPLHKLQKHYKEKDRRKRILLAGIVTTGATLMICGIGLIWAGRRYHKSRKTSARTGSNGGSSSRSKDANSQNLASKVSHDPGFDLFYLETLTTVLDPQACVKETSNYLNACSIQNSSSCTLYEKKNSAHERVELVARERSYSSAEEIISVHEYAESIKYDSDGHHSTYGDKITKIESHSSDGESFHSVCNSLSCSLRLSNASIGSLTETIQGFSPKRSDTSPYPPSLPQNLCTATASNSASSYKHPPPPPPPPPPLHANFSCLAPSQCKSSQPPSLPNASSQRNSDFKSGENQASASDLPMPPQIPEPPKPPSGILPPPCPPPLPIEKSNALKGPPPPPAQLPQFTPLGKDSAPLPKLKPLHWDKVRAAPDHSMVWDKLRSSSFELDEEMIESLFGYNLKTAIRNDEGKSKTPSPNKHVLEPKRLQNITILSKALNVTADQVCNALIQGDGLSLQQLEALVKMAPTKEEEAKLSNYKGDTNELGSAEKLVKAMLNIPFAFQRVDAMLYRATFGDEVVHLRNSLSMLEEACKELRSSRLFLKLLEAVLKTGNRMNVGTIRGGARAFKLDALLKLADVKGTDGKTTLLHFVVQEISRTEGIRMSESIIGKINQNNKSRTVEEKEDGYRRMGLELVSGLSAELCNVKKTASIDLDVLASSVSNLSDGMSKLRQLVHTDLCKDATNSNFVLAMKTFMSSAENNLKQLQNHEDKVLQSVREITEYFHGNVSKDEVNPLRIFVIVRDFLGMLDQVCKEIRSSKTPRSPNPLAPFQ